MLHRFSRPVSILVGLGFPRQIDSVDKAFAFLEDYPLLLRDESYQATRDACLEFFPNPLRRRKRTMYFAPSRDAGAC